VEPFAGEISVGAVSAAGTDVGFGVRLGLAAALKDVGA